MDEFLNMLRDYLEEVEVRTIPALAKKSGVSASTIRRWLSKEQAPMESKVRSVLRVIAETTDQFVQVMSTTFPESNQNLVQFHKSFKAKKSTDYYPTCSTLDFEIWVATGNSHGYDEKALVSLLGTQSVPRIEFLLEEETLRLNNGRLYSDELLFETAEPILDSIVKSTEVVRANSDKLKGLYFYTDRFTKDELAEIADYSREFVNKITSIVEREDRKKDGMPTCIGLLFGSLSSEDSNGGN